MRDYRAYIVFVSLFVFVGLIIAGSIWLAGYRHSKWEKECHKIGGHVETIHEKIQGQAVVCFSKNGKLLDIA